MTIRAEWDASAYPWYWHPRWTYQRPARKFVLRWGYLYLVLCKPGEPA